MIEPMDDDQLLRLVADSLGADHPPADALEAAYAAFAWRTVDADLAQLIEEAQPEVVGFLHHGDGPSGPEVREVAFQTDHGSIHIRIGERQVTLRLEPRPDRVVLRQPDRDQELAVDRQGWTTALGAVGPTRFEVTWPGGAAVTPWLTL